MAIVGRESGLSGGDGATAGDQIRVPEARRSTETPGDLAALSPAEVLDRVFVRLVASQAAPADVAPGCVRHLTDDLAEIVVVESAEGFVAPSDDLVARIGIGDLRAAGLANLLAQPDDEHESFDVDGAVVHLVAGNSGYTGSKVLALEQLAARVMGDAPLDNGVVVAVPNDHFVLFHVVDTAATAATEAIQRFALDAFREGVNPVSPAVYWWRAGRLRRLTRGQSAPPPPVTAAALMTLLAAPRVAALPMRLSQRQG